MLNRHPRNAAGALDEGGEREEGWNVLIIPYKQNLLFLFLICL